MSPRISCPECNTILRVRDRSFVGRKIQCPECKAPLKLEAIDRDGQLAARRLAADEQEAAKNRQPREQRIRLESAAAVPKQTPFRRIVYSKLTVGLLLLVGVVSFVAVLKFNPRIRVSGAKPPSVPVDTATGEPIEVPVRETPTPTPIESPQAPPTNIQIATIEIDAREAISALETDNVEGSDAGQPVAATDGREGDNSNEEPATPAPPKKIDIESKMAQKLVSYKQPPVSRQELLEALQEQLGVPIQYSREELGPAKLDDKISFEFQNTTIGEVVQFVVKQAGWQIVTEDQGIRLTP